MTVTTDMGTIGGDINNIVNGSGLPGDIPSLTGIHDRASGNNYWFGGFDVGNTITFNLNGQYSLAGFSLWNYNDDNTAGVNGVNVLTSTDGTNFTTLAGAPTQFAIGVAAGPEDPEQFSFTPVNASYVRFQVLSNHGYGFDWVGLVEVQFDGSPPAATAVPEPVTIFGTLIGLGGGAALKRRLRDVRSKSV